MQPLEQDLLYNAAGPFDEFLRYSGNVWNKKWKSERWRRSGGGSTSERLMVPPWKDCETSSTEKGMLQDTGNVEDSKVIRLRRNWEIIDCVTLNRRLARKKGKSCWLNLPPLVFSSAWSPIIWIMSPSKAN